MRLMLKGNLQSRQWQTLALAAAVLAAGLLAGCGTSDTGLQPAAARQLQARVLEVSEASSRNDPAGALKALDGLEADLAGARSKGQVSEERSQTIAAIAATVRADLNEVVAAGARAAEEARIAAEKAAAEASPPPLELPVPAPSPDPVPAPAPESEPEPGSDAGDDDGNDDDKKGNEGKGKGKD